MDDPYPLRKVPFDMDLTKEYPRSVRAEMHGIVQMPRTIDKAKAVAHGTAGEYHYNCPMDVAVFAFLGIDHEALMDVVKKAKSDAEIDAYVKTFTDKKTPEDLAAWNRQWLLRGPEPGGESEKFFLDLRSDVAPNRTDVSA